MSDGWRELGVRTELTDAAAERGFDAPSALQRAAVPVLRRGGNAVLHASYGAGLTAAYGIALLDRTAESATTSAPRVLVVTPTGARAASAADELAALARGLPVRVAALTPGWRDAEAADLVVGSLANVAGAIGRSALKLEGLQAIVVESLSALLAEGGRAALDTVMTAVPREAQRVVTSAADDSAVDRFVEEHARRAMRIPARPADRAVAAGAEPIGEIHYLVVPEYDKDVALARLLVRSSGEDVLVATRSSRRAEQVRTMLDARGHEVGAGALRVESATEAPPRGARVIAYDPPMDAATLAHLHTGAGLVLVTPGELAHLRLLAAEANVALRAEKARAGDRDIGAAFRAEVRRALEERDLDAQLLLLDPLFDEYSAAEVAAALSSLLRERQGAARAATERSTAPGSAEGVAGAPGAPATFTRLFLSIGSRDGIRAGDLVGAITGEANVTGAEVGRIDLRDTFSVVEVVADAAERVIRALNGTTMRGRALRVDYDRRGATAQKERAPGPRERGRGAQGGADRPRRPRPDGGERVRRPRRDPE